MGAPPPNPRQKLCIHVKVSAYGGWGGEVRNGVDFELTFVLVTLHRQPCSTLRKIWPETSATILATAIDTEYEASQRSLEVPT